MVKVLIADDEKVIREGIGRFIKRMDCFQVVDLCDNGLSAYEAIQKFEPDLVISDVVMPKCNGTELVEKCRENGNKCEFILISGYSEFEYARSVIKYNVLDYICKPIKPSTLSAILRRAKEKIEQKKYKEYKNKCREYAHILQTKQLNIKDTSMKGSNIQYNMSHRVLLIHFWDEQYRLMDVAESTKQCKKIIEKIIRGDSVVFDYKGFIIIIIVGQGTEQNLVEKLCSTIVSESKVWGYNAFIGVGNIVPELTEIFESFCQSKIALYDGEFHKSSICFFESLPYEDINPKKIYSKDFAIMEQFIRENNYNKLVSYINEITNKYLEMPPYIIYGLIERCVQVNIFVLDGLGISVKSVWQGDIISDLASTPDISMLLKRFIDFSGKVFETRIKAKQTQHNSIIDEIIQYINLYYREDISIEKIANKFFINPSYFSSLFKEETGMNYNDYLTDLRINKAKQLLVSGQYKVKEVAGMVGYSSPRYFSRLFYSKVGMLPKRYKENNNLNTE